MLFNEIDLDFGLYYGYWIIDYYDVNIEYGMMDDLENFISEVKICKMCVMMDLVINYIFDIYFWFVDV